MLSLEFLTSFHSLWALYLNDIVPPQRVFCSLLVIFTFLSSTVCTFQESAVVRLLLSYHMTCWDLSPIYIARISFLKVSPLSWTAFAVTGHWPKILFILPLALWHHLSKVYDASIAMLSSFLFWLLKLWNNMVTLKTSNIPKFKILIFLWHLNTTFIFKIDFLLPKIYLSISGVESKCFTSIAYLLDVSTTCHVLSMLTQCQLFQM